MGSLIATPWHPRETNALKRFDY
ncbi:uncharacterized protein G2W53_025775 [Senna tora]|uniref:Uncharacterized protein n=1 Tax=Senna tora TaxID=362788 RepID=A0A834TEL1_9FABA|nr:uncharacterized protein G2W53_025775 [Senna tora]